MRLMAEMTVQARGRRFRIVDCQQGGRVEDDFIHLIKLQDLDEPNFSISLIVPLEKVEPAEVPEPSLQRPGRLALFRLFHHSLLLESSGIGQSLLAPQLAPIRREDYQLVPVHMALSLPRPRLLIADDVGLGKTIEAGLILMELHARRRANRVLIVCPASLRHQWQREMQVKFGFRFVIFDRNTLAQKRRELEAGINPWAHEPRIIASMDFLKRPDGAFRELQGLHWDVIIVDEAHHVAPAGAGESDKQLLRLGRFLSEACDALLLLTATPHNGYDESMATLLRFLDPTLAPSGQPLNPQRYRRHYIRRLKSHIKNPDGTQKFILREPVQPLAVHLSDAENAFYGKVRSYAQAIWAAAEQARDERDRSAFQFVATILCKRAASSQAALKNSLQRRLQVITEQLEEVEADRELLRRFRRGEPLTPDEQRKLENDAYLNYLSAMRRLRKELVQLQEEQLQVKDLLDELIRLEQQSPDPKLLRLLQWLQELHQKQPETKVLVFSEYVDTVNAIAKFLSANGYEGKVVTATGEDPERDQKEAIHRFLFGEGLILVATDIAGEGLNLHYTCHHLVHFELPWNPNRLEQRNGRIDRYGQTKPPIIAFLYLANTYEDEVLARLLEKLDRKLRAEGTVTDLLGSFQQEHLERLLMSQKTIDEADSALDELLKAKAPRESLAEGEEGLLMALRRTLPETPFVPNLDEFLRSAVLLVNGQWYEQDGHVSVQTPTQWLALDPEIQPQYEHLYLHPPDDPSISPDAILHPNHPLVKAALQWFHRLRFEPQQEEIRLAYQVVPDLNEPEMIVTFLVTLPDKAGLILTLLEPVQVTRSNVSTDEKSDRQRLADALSKPGENVDITTLERLFADWWKEGRQIAYEQARERAEGYRRQLHYEREQHLKRMLGEWQAWREAMEREILGEYWQQYAQRPLFSDMEAKLPPAIQRRLRQHRQQAEALREQWQRWATLLPPTLEEVGILLRVPRSML